MRLRRHGPLKIALVLVVLGLIWIFGSDYVVSRLFRPAVQSQIQTVKGTVFVLTGGLLAYLLVGGYQSELEELIGRLERAQAVADLGSWELDLATRELRWSAQVYEIFGASRDEVDPDYETFLSFVHTDDREKMEAAQEAALAGRGPLDIEHRIVRSDGEVRWVREQARLVHVEGEPVALSGTVQDITERKQLEEQVRHRSLHDPLTDLPNRSLFQDRLETALRRSRRHGGAVALLLVDLHRFKEINDALGHSRGDRVLQEAARRISGCVRASDTVARLGGDEFAVLLEDSDGRRPVHDVTRRIDDALAEPLVIGGEKIQLEARIGMVRRRPGNEETVSEADSVEEFVRHADLALHRAKERNSHHLYVPEEEYEISGRYQREQRLRRALEEDELEVHYQPVVDLGSWQIVGLEALARWRHPERGLVGPGEFIPLAEETGLIRPLGRAVLRKACRRVGQWDRDGSVARPLVLSVNLSSRQLEDDGCLPSIRKVVESESFDPTRLQLEITETAVMRAPQTLERFQHEGFRVAIDDFGTGYASFTYLRDLDLDALKLDISFVRGVADDDRSRAICRTVARLGDAFGLTVIAEGIETRDQCRCLEELGCPLGQGYLLARPRPAEAVLPLVRQGAIRKAS